MKKLPTLIFCLCVMFASVCFAKADTQQCVMPSPMPTQKAKKNSLDFLYPFRYLFSKITGKEKKQWIVRPFLNIECLELSRTEVVTSSSDSQKIEVKATPSGNFDQYDIITFNYTVSGGKIVGRGANVIWDLSSVKPGTYSISAAADNGCGICGMTKTIEVKVIECPNCN